MPKTAEQFTVVEILDATEFRALSERLPGDNRRHHYRLRDPAISSAGPLSQHVLRIAGDLQVSWVAEQAATTVEVLEPGIPAHCFSTIESGQMALSVPSAPDWVESGPHHGLIHGGRGGTAALTLAGTDRTNLWVSSARIESALAANLDDAVREPVVFRPVVDWNGAGGRSVQRLLAHVSAEFEQAEGLATQPLALESFTDLFVHSVLNNLPHNYSERLAQELADTAPRHVRRAEAFMEAQAGSPVQLAEIAAAAGCSVRSLQNAFRRFRGTTPFEVLQRIRLERAQADLRQGDVAVDAVARRYGFSNAGRFAALYTRRFGEKPSRSRPSASRTP